MEGTDDLLLGNEPLPEDESTITLEVFSEQTLQGSYGPESKKRVEGKITIPKQARIFRLSPTLSTADRPSLAPDRTQTDLYLICLPFTLHEPPTTAYYEKVTLFVEFADEQYVAFDLFPKHITSSVTVTKTYKLSPQATIEPVEQSLGEISRQITFTALHPVITAFGVGENKFYWVYKAPENQSERPAVTPETKQVLIVLEVPAGTESVNGQVEYEVALVKRRFGIWRLTKTNVDAYPLHWTLHGALPFFEPMKGIQTGITPTIATRNKPPHVDVCVICAMPKETQTFIEMASQFCKVAFTQDFSQINHRAYQYGTLQNQKGENLTLLVSWSPRYGLLESGLHIRAILDEFQPHFVAMTGICAGDRRQVKLGDLIVAERTFVYDSGKVVRGADGSLKQLADVDTQRMDTGVLHLVQMFHAWQQDVYPLARPASKRQQREWLLNRLLTEHIGSVDEIPRAELEQHVPNWHKIVHELTEGPDAYLTKERILRNKARVNQLRYGQEEFPFIDPPHPACHIVPLASGSGVRSDDPFPDIQRAVRGTLALDMEAAAFYRTVADFSGTRALLVKGVTDFADSEKDDSYHTYAEEASALYVLNFIKAYISPIP